MASHIQLEGKTYATSWHPGEAVRAPSLTRRPLAAPLPTDFGIGLAVRMLHDSAAKDRTFWQAGPYALRYDSAEEKLKMQFGEAVAAVDAEWDEGDIVGVYGGQRDGKLFLQAKVDGEMDGGKESEQQILPNLIRNGDFSGDYKEGDPNSGVKPYIDKWILWGNAEIAGHAWKIQNNKILLDGSIGGNGGFSQDIEGNVGDIFYIALKLLGTNTSVFRLTRYDYMTYNNSEHITSHITAEYPSYSLILSNDRESGFRFGINYSAGGTFYNRTIDNVRIVNLTAAFGPGNEPDKEWCDANLAWTPAPEDYEPIDTITIGSDADGETGHLNGVIADFAYHSTPEKIDPASYLARVPGGGK